MMPYSCTHMATVSVKGLTCHKFNLTSDELIHLKSQTCVISRRWHNTSSYNFLSLYTTDVSPDRRICTPSTPGICHADASCTPVTPYLCSSTQARSYKCECNQGYSGDGINCTGMLLCVFLDDRTNGRAIATLLRLSSSSSVCDVMYCG